MAHTFRKFKKQFTRFARRKRLAVVCCGLFGFLLPCVYWFFQGNLPIPTVHDEFAYLLAADTFAHFRFTNPTHQLWQFFEAPHILSVPTYTAKYPPMQGVFLALGQILFGHPAFGIWLGCAFAAAAICWMLQAWTKPKFALLGAILFVMFFGFLDYWAHTFWGGPVACGGAALFLGAFRRILSNKPTIFLAFILAIGAVILANSRPFEGFLTIFPASVSLLFWLIQERKVSFAEKSAKLLLPCFFIGLFGIGVMLFYNKQITGDYFKMPYSLHTQQYLSAPLFIFQAENKPTLIQNERLRKFDAKFIAPKNPVWSEAALNFLRLLLNVGNTCFPLILFLPFLVQIVGVLKNRFALFAFGTVLTVFFGMAFAVYSGFAHYFAPVVPLTIFLMTEGFRHWRVSAMKVPKILRPLFAVRLIILLGFISIYLQMIYADESESFFSKSRLFSKINLEGSPLKPRLRNGRENIRKIIENEPENHLIFVEYAKNYSPHDEWVYNSADIDTQKIIWAHDLGKSENQKLIDYYGDKRAVWKVFISWENTIYTKIEASEKKNSR